MSESEPNPSAAVDNTTTDAALENVTLRIVILAHGSGREDDLYLVLSLDTTLGELKSRIQESLPQRPSPSHQRIIYQGRGLDNANEPLRNILRQDPRGGNSSYVLHLVIRQPPAGSQPEPAVPAAIPQQPPVDNPLHPRQPQVQVPLVQVPQLSPQDAHMRIHTQIHQLQHSLQHQQALNRAHLAQVQQSHPNIQNTILEQVRRTQQMFPNLTTGQPQAANQAPSSPAVSSTQDSASDQIPSHPQTHRPASIAGGPVPNPSNPRLPHLHAPHAGPAPMHSPFMSTTQIRTAIDPNGQQTRTVVNGGPTGTTTMTFRITGLNPPNPLDRPSSAPGSSPSADADPSNRVINPVPGNIQIHAQPPPIPLGFPFPPGLQLPFPIPGMMPQINNPLQQMTSHASAPQPMAWLLSSPAGPQGIVFAPGHGFFSTAPTATTIPSQLQPTPTAPDPVNQLAAAAPQQGQLMVRPQPGTSAPPAPQPGARPQPPAGDLPIPPQPRAAVRARARPNNDQNDILQFIITRGWLFLRLYMFVFVFSESGTWRRILMIGAIIIYCALPQRNPLTNGLQVLRRHFDNLIGPPNLPQRQPQQPQADNQNPGQGGATQPNNAQAGTAPTERRTAPMPTPEETARRLLEQQNRRNPNPVIDALYRFEQGMVLFLASLVPGVGERHVRAREEARRIIQEEEQRRITDAQQQAQPAISNEPSTSAGQSDSQPEERRQETEGGPLLDGWKSTTQLHEETSGQQATSSGVDRTGQSGGEGVRSRAAPSGQ